MAEQDNGGANLVAAGRFYKMIDLGILFTRDCSFEEWNGLGKYIGGIWTSVPWMVGDWLIYGEARFGEAYAQAIDDTGLDYGTLRNYKHVAKVFDPVSRVRGLSFSHHEAVAALGRDKALEWLGKAKENGWSSKDLRYRSRGGTVDDDFGQDGIPTSDGIDWLNTGKEAWKKMSPQQREHFLLFIEGERLKRKPASSVA